MRHEADPTPLICQGSWEGVITETPCGSNGFGYDPVFYVPTENNCSAELSAEVKNQLSHRGQALRQFIDIFKNQG
jgi:XTP/dITP diphosphohydrolase